MADTPGGLQIATRIHVLLLHEIGQGIDIEQMLRNPRYARDVLWVCDACHGSELAPLAQQFRQALPQLSARPVRGAAKRPSEWGPVSTDFGLSQPMGLQGGPDFAARARAWISRWWPP